MMIIVPRGLTLPTGSVALYTVCSTSGILNYNLSSFAITSMGGVTVSSRNPTRTSLGEVGTTLSNVAILATGVFTTTHATAN